MCFAENIVQKRYCAKATSLPGDLFVDVSTLTCRYFLISLT